MVGIVGPCGTGKTMVLQALAREGHGVYIRCHQHLTRKQLALRLAEALAIKRARRATTSDLLVPIGERLAIAGRRGILLDEADRLNGGFDTISALRGELPIPIVMAGIRPSGTWRDAIRGTEWWEAANHTMPPDGKVPSTGRQLYTLDEIARFCEDRGAHVCAEAMDMLHRIACVNGLGGLARVESFLLLAKDQSPQPKMLGLADFDHAASVL